MASWASDEVVEVLALPSQLRKSILNVSLHLTFTINTTSHHHHHHNVTGNRFQAPGDTAIVKMPPMQTNNGHFRPKEPTTICDQRRSRYE